jgi:hypothetical protein
MVDIDTVRSWQGRTMTGPDGAKVGTIEAIYLDDQTGEPEWALVNTGLFGTRSTFVPLAQAADAGDSVQVPYGKQLVKDAPNINPDAHLSEQEEQELWRRTTAWSTAPGTTAPTGTVTASTTAGRRPRWAGTPRGRPPTTP